MNRVELIGNLVRNPEIKYTQSGKAVAMFSIAVNDGYGDNQKTYYPNIVVWGKAAEAVGNNLTKGSKVGICGKLTTRSYDKNGQKVYVTEVVADMYGGVEFLSSKQGGQPAQSNAVEEDIDVPF